MKKLTAEDCVQDFLFANKPNRTYHKKFDVKDLENLLTSFAQQAVDERDEEIGVWIKKKMPNQEIMQQLRSELLLGKTELLNELREFLQIKAIPEAERR